MKTLRRSLDWPVINVEIAKYVSAWDIFQEAQTVLLYAPMKDEPDLLPLIPEFSEKHWFLPKVISEAEMIFINVDKASVNNALLLSSLGVYEPPHPDESSKLYQHTTPCLVFVPGIAFDKKGYRLGYGKGYYDRFLSSLMSQNAQVITVGVLPKSLIQEELPKDTWDIPVDYLATETGIIKV